MQRARKLKRSQQVKNQREGTREHRNNGGDNCKNMFDMNHSTKRFVHIEQHTLEGLLFVTTMLQV